MEPHDEPQESLSLGVIVPDLSREGGAERLALECVRRWQDRHRITLYATRFDAKLLERHGISSSVARTFLPELLPPGAAPAFARRLLEGYAQPRAWSQALDEHDVYLAHQWPGHLIERRPLVWYAHEAQRPAYDLLRERPESAVAGELRGFLAPRPRAPGQPRRPVPADRHNDLVQGLLRDLDRRATPDRVVANSRYTAQQLRHALGRDDVDVVYPGVDPDGFAPPRFEEPFFLSVGSLHLHKRQRLAIEAVSLVPGARLVVVGVGPEAERLERMAAVLGVGDRVSIRNEVEDGELRDLYAECRALLFTPLREPFGMVALEALAAGKPVVAVDEGGFTECLDASCAALVPDEPSALADALRALLERPEDAARMGRAGRKIAEAHAWERTARELETILREARARGLETSLHEARGLERTLRQGRARPAPERASGPAARIPIGVRVVATYGDGLAEGGWRRVNPRPPMPRAGFYASHHESTLRRQLAEIGRAGFDFVVLGLALDDRWLFSGGIATLHHALALAPELGEAARFGVELTLEAPTRALLGRALDWLADRLPGEPAALARDGRPLVWLRSHPHRPMAPPWPDHEALCVIPSQLGRGSAPVVVADDGLAPALAALHRAPETPERIVVSSWNDYQEGTALEPTVDGGEQRLQAMRAILQALREG